MKYEKTRAYKVTQSYLRGVLASERKIQSLEAEIEKQKSRLDVMGVNFDEKTFCGPSDAMGDGVIRLREYIEEMQTDLVAYTEERKQAAKVLANIAEKASFDVLWYRYFEGLRFREISKLMAYSEDHVYRLHREAICELHRYLPREVRGNHASKCQLNL